MHRIDTPTAQADKFGQGKNGYTDGDPATGRKATNLNAEMFDSLQEEVCNVIEGQGIALEKNKRDQLAQAIAAAATKAVSESALLIAKNLKEIAANGSRAQADARDNLSVLSRQEVSDGYLNKQTGGLVTGPLRSMHTLSISSPASGKFAQTDTASINIGDSDTGFIYAGDGILDMYANNTRMFRWDQIAKTTFCDNTFRCFGDYQTTVNDGFRIVQPNTSMFWRYDGSNAYLMFTKEGDPQGSWSDRRPLIAERASGNLRTESDFIARGSVFTGDGNATYYINGDIHGPAWDGWLSTLVRDAYQNRVADVAFGARWTGVVPSGGGIEPNNGLVMTGWYTEGSAPGGDTVAFRPVMKYFPGTGWLII